MWPILSLLCYSTLPRAIKELLYCNTKRMNVNVFSNPILWYYITTMAKSALRLQARGLRENGLGVKTIAYQLNVSSSTVSLWTRDIRLTEKQIHTLEQRARDPQYGRRLEYTIKQQDQRKSKIEHLLQQGIKDVGDLTKRELFVAGINLYWAEGFKKDNLVGFSNSDPEMIRLFIKWLDVCCHVEKNRIKLRLGLNEQYIEKVEEIESFWVKQLHISKEQFQKPFFQKVQWKKIYDNPEDYHGVLRVRVAKSTDLLRLIHGWIQGMKQVEYY